MSPKSYSPKRSGWTWQQRAGLLAVMASIGLHQNRGEAQQFPLPLGNPQLAWVQSTEVPPTNSVSMGRDAAHQDVARTTSNRDLPISGFGYSNWNSGREAPVPGDIASKTQTLPRFAAQATENDPQSAKTLPSAPNSNTARNASNPQSQFNFFNVVTRSPAPSTQNSGPTKVIDTQPRVNPFDASRGAPTRVAESNSSSQKTNLSDEDFFDAVTKGSAQPQNLRTSFSEPDQLQPVPGSNPPVSQGSIRPAENVKSPYNFFNVVTKSPAGSANQNHHPGGAISPILKSPDTMRRSAQEKTGVVSMQSAKPGATPQVNFFNVITPAPDAKPGRNRGSAPFEVNHSYQSVNYAFQDQEDRDERQGSSDLASSETRLGTEPPSNELVFLRRQTVLLAQGQTQFDTGFFYSHLDDDRPVAAINGGGNVVGVVEARTRQRLLAAPFEIRYGFTDRIQLFANTIVGWSNSELAFNSFTQTEDIAGIGDTRFGMSMLLKTGQCDTPDIVFTLGATAPTGNDSFITANLVPNAQLGQGFWSLFGNLLFVHTWDPIVLYYGVGYNHRFDGTFVGIEVDPGEEFDYQLGVGFAVNSNISLSASFQGAYITQFLVDGDLIEGSTLEPMRARLAVTVARNGRIWEPFAEIPMTDDAAARVGMTWTF